MDSQDPLDAMSMPTTPELSPSTVPEESTAAISKAQTGRTGSPRIAMTPPPSTQINSSSHAKTRTPTPPVSHISTPPPTIELLSQGQDSRFSGGLVGSLTAAELESASPEELRTTCFDLRASLQEAKMSAAHHKLQYQMLSQESAAAIERMAVEARMAQSENEVIHHAEQARAAATPQPSPAQEGMIPVQKELYQRMCRDLQLLQEANQEWRMESEQKQAIIERQEDEISSLTDKVTLMRERIRESKEHLHKYRRSYLSRADATPRSVYSTPHRSHGCSQHQTQPFAALLQASEMVSQESARSASGRGKKGHSRNVHSTSSLPTTPQRMQKGHHLTYSTPSGRQIPPKIPSTAPMPKTSALRIPGDVYNHPSLPVSQSSPPRAPQSDGTVSASENEDDDSEAETDIIERDDEIGESFASRAASQMLRSSQEQQQAKRESFKGSGMLQSTGDKMRQTKLFGSVRKANVERDEERPNKRKRTGGLAVGLGIAGVRD